VMSERPSNGVLAGTFVSKKGASNTVVNQQKWDRSGPERGIIMKS